MLNPESTLPPHAFELIISHNLYDILGLPTALVLSQEIKVAYRREALRWHPDKNIGRDAKHRSMIVSRFHAISYAYNILSNEARRKAYDISSINAPNIPHKIPSDMTYEDAVQEFVSLAIDLLRERGTPFSGSINGTFVYSLFSACIEVDRNIVCDAVESMISGECVKHRLSRLTSQQKAAVYHGARVLMEIM